MKIKMNQLFIISNSKEIESIFTEEEIKQLYSNKKHLLDFATITSPINNLNYSIILYGKNRCKKIITQRVV